MAGSDRPLARRLAEAYASLVVRLRFLIVAGWLAGAVVVTLYLPSIQDSSRGNLGGLIPADNPAIQAEIRSVTLFGFPVLGRVAVVQRDPQGLDIYAQARAGLRAVTITQRQYPGLEGILGALPVLNSGGRFPSSSEDGTTAITYLFMDPRTGFGTQTDLANRLAAEHINRPTDHLVGVTGSIPARVEQGRLIHDNLPLVELATVSMIFLIVALNFRALVAPAVTLLAAGVAYQVTVQSVGLIGQLFGVAVPSELEPLIVALLLGIVTDYAIFFLSGMRFRLAEGHSGIEAARRSTAEYAPIILAAGITVAAGAAALVAAKLELFRSFGPGMALTILIGLAVSITLIPALLAILGPSVYWPSRPGPRDAGAAAEADGAGQQPGDRLVRALTTPKVARMVVLGCVLVLAAAALAVTRLGLGMAIVDSLPPDNPISRAAVAAREGFAPGILSPTVLLVEREDVTSDRTALARLEELLEREPGVAGVFGPGEQLTPLAAGVVLSQRGDAARYLIVLDEEPLGATAIARLRALDERMPTLLQAAGLPLTQFSFAGDTALAEGVVDRTEQDLGRIALAALIIQLLLLVAFLRALVAPLYLLAANVLALAASLGVTTIVFIVLVGAEGLTFYVPFAAAVLLVALGSDYNIFGVGHVWEKAHQLPLRQAIIVAVPETTRAITVAGVILALSFGMLALVPLRPLREFAFAMFVGILLDAFLVRSLLVPGLLSLVGRFSGWPGGQLRQSPAE